MKETSNYELHKEILAVHRHLCRPPAGTHRHLRRDSRIASRFPYAESFRQKVIKLLKKQKLLRTFYRDGLRGLRLTAAGKRLMLDTYPDRLDLFLTGAAETNRLKSEPGRRLRLYRMAEASLMMVNAGVRVFPWEKPLLLAPESSEPIPAGDRGCGAFLDDALSPDIRIEQASYYSSREIKEIGDEAVKIRGSRATGVLFTESRTFAIYNTGSTDLEWDRNAERRFRITLDVVFQRRLTGLKDWQDRVGAILLGAEMQQLLQLLSEKKSSRHNGLVLHDTYEQFFYLPNDQNGAFILRLLCDDGLRNRLDDILREGLEPENTAFGCDNDAFDGDIPVLFGYTCDMVRLWRFGAAMEENDREGIVICFDFQLDAFEGYFGPNVLLQVLDTEACKRVLLSPDEDN